MPYKHKFNVNGKSYEKKLTASKALHFRCLICMGDKCGGKASKKDVERCTEFACPAFPYRMGGRAMGGLS